MPEEYVPRPEFDMFCRQQNGSLKRIEAQNIEILSELKEIRGDMNGRVTWDSFDRYKDEMKGDMEKCKGKPSWLTTLALTILSSACVGLITGLLVAVLR